MADSAMTGWMRGVLLAMSLLLTGLVFAVPRNTDDRRVTAADVASAIRNSPDASPWLRTNAEAVANLAMYESGGSLSIYNGSCCYGILQLNTENIGKYANTTPADFRTWSLQDQVDAWARVTNVGLGTQIVQSFIGLGTFDGRPVDNNLVLACVQLGVGNCKKMINSGQCSGFADSNGTTICKMADKMAGGAGSGSGSGGSGTGAGSGAGTGAGSPLPGGGMSSLPPQSVDAGFEQGSGVSMGSLKTTIHAIAVAVTLLVVGGALLGLWRQYAGGRITKPELILAGQQAGLIVVTIFIVLTLA